MADDILKHETERKDPRTALENAGASASSEGEEAFGLLRQTMQELQEA